MTPKPMPRSLLRRLRGAVRPLAVLALAALPLPAAAELPDALSRLLSLRAQVETVEVRTVRPEMQAEQATPVQPAANRAIEAQAIAAPPMSAEEFDARTVGRTITYSAFGTPYGTEEYLPDRRVRWAFEGDSCKEGSWFPQGEQICFLYDDGTDLQCWTFHDTDDGLVAFFNGNQAEEPLVSLTESPLPLVCAGPDVGV